MQLSVNSSKKAIITNTVFKCEYRPVYLRSLIKALIMEL